MKKSNLILKAMFFVAVALSVTSCGDDDPAPSTPTASAFVEANANFSSLKAALDRADLTATLNGAGPFTIFAPTNDAFEEFLDDNNFLTLNDVPVDVLRNVLLNHVVSGTVRSTDLTNGYVKTLATNTDGDNLDLYVDIRAGVILNAGPEVTAANTVVSNGIIHVIDEVIALPTVVTLAAANPAFSSLVAAVSQEGLVPTLSSLTAPAPFTVFAPLDSSFQALIDADPNDGLSSIQDILALTNLSDILTYHVVSGAMVRAEDITNGQVVNPLGPGTFTMSTAGGVSMTDSNMRVTNVIVTDVTAINGVVHAIDNVLLPQ